MASEHRPDLPSEFNIQLTSFNRLTLGEYIRTFGYFSLPINLFGAVVIVRGSTEAMGGYKWHLLNFQIWSSMFEFVMCTLITNVPLENFASGFCLGLLPDLLGPVAMFYSAVAASICLVLLYCSIVQCFACRQQALLSQYAPFRLSNRNFVLVCVFVNVVAVAVVSYLLYASYRIWIESIYELNVYYVLEVYDHYYNLNTDVVNLVLYYPVLGIIAIGIILIAVFAISSIYILMSAGQNLSAKTKEMQWRFLKVLILQTSMPIMLIVVPLIYRMVTDAYSETYLGGREEIGLIGYIVWDALQCHGLLSTLSLLLLKPFRDYVIKVFYLGKLQTAVRSSFPSWSVSSVPSTGVSKPKLSTITTF